MGQPTIQEWQIDELAALKPGDIFDYTVHDLSKNKEIHEPIILLDIIHDTGYYEGERMFKVFWPMDGRGRILTVDGATILSMKGMLYPDQKNYKMLEDIDIQVTI